VANVSLRVMDAIRARANRSTTGSGAAAS